MEDSRGDGPFHNPAETKSLVFHTRSVQQLKRVCCIPSGRQFEECQNMTLCGEKTRCCQSLKRSRSKQHNANGFIEVA
eukprot:337190-Amphidinium_carterae.2